MNSSAFGEHKDRSSRRDEHVGEALPAAQALAAGQQSELPSFVQPVMSVDIGTASQRQHAARKKATSAPRLAGGRSGEGNVAHAMRNQWQAKKEAAWWREAMQ